MIQITGILPVDANSTVRLVGDADKNIGYISTPYDGHYEIELDDDTYQATITVNDRTTEIAVTQSIDITDVLTELSNLSDG